LAQAFLAASISAWRGRIKRDPVHNASRPDAVAVQQGDDGSAAEPPGATARRAGLP
jgi:hypothetical protein